MELGPRETWSIRAAQGWLGLGCIREAKAELRTIPRHFRAHPIVLAVRSDIYAAAGKWKLAGRAARLLTKALPDVSCGWVQAANALHHMKQTELARDILRCIFHDFPHEFLIPYRLACYSCQLGNFHESWNWLKLAIQIGGNAIRPSALGKKNRLFVGHPEAGEGSAVIYTLLGSCRRHGVNPFEYLKDLFARLPAAKITQIKEFMPSEWAKAKEKLVAQALDQTSTPSF